MRSFALLCLFGTVILSLWEMTESVDSKIYGERQENDKLLYQTHATKQNTDYVVLTDILKFPGELPSQGGITMMNVTNLSDENIGGTATLVSGGVGHDNVVFSISSQLNEGYDFTFDIYGFSKSNVAAP